MSASGHKLVRAVLGSPPVPAGSEERPPGRASRTFYSAVFIVGQVLLLASLYSLYNLGRRLAVGREPEALAHARHVWHAERLLDLPNESAVQALALHSTNLLEFANRFYIMVHFPAAILFLLWVLIRHRPSWRRVRTVIMASTGVALLIHIAYPLAPPRFLPRMVPGVNLVDTGAVFGPSPYGPDDTVANQYAAMPSLHIGWAILEAWGVITILRARARWLVLLHPVITTLVVVVTANHYWIDGIIGGTLVGIAVQLTRPEVQMRIRLWAVAWRLPVNAVPAASGALAGGADLVGPGSGPARGAAKRPVAARGAPVRGVFGAVVAPQYDSPGRVDPLRSDAATAAAGVTPVQRESSEGTRSTSASGPDG